MTLRFRIIDREKTLLVIEDDNPNFAASAQFAIIGDKAFAHTINGAKFYQCVRENLPAIFEGLGIRSIEAYVFPAHLRLIKMMLKKCANVQHIENGIMDGHEMAWVKITLLS